MNSAGTLGSGAISVAATYGNGRFSLYVPGYSPNQSLSPSQGIFVQSKVAGTWSPPGSAYTTAQPIQLQRGWNLAGAPIPVAGLDASTIVSEASACTVQEVAIYSGGAYHTYTPSSGGTLHVASTSGMWIECTGQGSWTPS
jgi:hypothetical protein